MAKSSILNRAKEAKEDEYYTQLSDIEDELKHYRKHFAGKTVLCNCDDPFESNFFKYFVLNFNKLKLKKLICTCYSGSHIAYEQLSLLDTPYSVNAERTTPYKAVVTAVHDADGDGYIRMSDIRDLFISGENTLTRLKGNGDYASPECLKLMDEADIVVTNPPFSLFINYVSTLLDRGKQFIIIGSQNNITYKSIFPRMMNNEMWVGYTHPKVFMVPEDRPDRKNIHKSEDGRYYATFGNICWFTNVDIKKRHEDLLLYRKYKEDDYIHYDNFDAIDVETLNDIPCDYSGMMGVPCVSLFDYFNPDQFEIIGFTKGALGKKTGIAKNYRGRTDIALTRPDGSKFCPYGRMIIRNKHPQTPTGGNE